MNEFTARLNGLLLQIFSKFTFNNVRKLEMSDVGLIALIFANT
jgi:hypothetical protein